MVLEARIKKLEHYIRCVCALYIYVQPSFAANLTTKLHPGEDIERIINAPAREISRSPSISSGIEASSGSFSSADLRYPSSPPMDIMTAATTPIPEDESVASEDDDDLAHVALSEDLKKLSTTATDNRFFGEAR